MSDQGKIITTPISPTITLSCLDSKLVNWDIVRGCIECGGGGWGVRVAAVPCRLCSLYSYIAPHPDNNCYTRGYNKGVTTSEGISPVGCKRENNATRRGQVG